MKLSLVPGICKINFQLVRSVVAVGFRVRYRIYHSPIRRSFQSCLVHVFFETTAPRLPSTSVRTVSPRSPISPLHSTCSLHLKQCHIASHNGHTCGIREHRQCECTVHARAYSPPTRQTDGGGIIMRRILRARGRHTHTHKGISPMASISPLYSTRALHLS